MPSLASLETNLIGKEKEHYDTLETLWAYGNGAKVDNHKLADALSSTVADWERMRGSAGNLARATAAYIDGIRRGEPESAVNIYLYLSPIFFFIRALGRISRKDWRETVTACGIYCERIVRNLILELDAKSGSMLWAEMKEAKLEQKNGRLKSELEKMHFDAINLYGSIRRIYSVRSSRGPHDVPPPLPIQAKISVTECLPVYLDYLDALEHVGSGLPNPEEFVDVFSDTTRVQPTLAFGEEITGPIPFKEFLKDVIYREGFFYGGRTSTEVLAELGRRRRNYDEATAKNGLKSLCSGKEAILSKKKGKAFLYSERVPPDEYFKPVA